MLVPIILNNLISNEQYTRKVLPHLLPEYFSITSERIVFEFIRNYFYCYAKLPTIQVLKLELFNKSGINSDVEKECLNLISELDALPANEEYIVRQTEQFCQDSSLEIALRKSIEIIEDKKGKLDRGSIPKILSDALAVSFDPHIGHDFIEDCSKRFEYYHTEEERIPFDIEILNKITSNGIARKTLTILMAATGVGKSLCMCHFAAADLLIGKNVLYITLEMSEERIAERIDANLLDIPIKQLERIPQSIYETKIMKLKEKLTGRLIIKEYPTAAAGADHFRYLLNELKLKKKFIPDIIFVDYLNICRSSRIKYTGNVNTYLYVMTIAQEIRGLGVEYDVPVFTATQLNRQGFQDSDPGMEHASDSFGTMAQADLILIAMSNEELAQLGQIAFKQVKNRYNDLNYYSRFVVGCDRSKMRLYNLDINQSSSTNGSENVEVPVMDRGKEKERFMSFT